MAKFIKLTEAGPQGRTIAINIDAVEYILPRSTGTELVSITYHTKYVVRESADDILSYLDDIGMVITLPTAKETCSIADGEGCTE